jgi:fermentation-respiration switch protein FrsA (DUF1100 family)
LLSTLLILAVVVASAAAIVARPGAAAAADGELDQAVDVGVWVGGYEVGGEWNFVEVEFAHNAGELVAGVDVRFDRSIVDFADPLVVDGDQVRIEVALQSSELVLDGTIGSSVYAGRAGVDGTAGTFELRRVVDLPFDDYRALAGTYRLGSETRLLVAIRDRDRYLSYDPGEGREVRLYPLVDGTFLSELGERLTPTGTGIDWVRADGTTTRAEPVELHREEPVTFHAGEIEITGTIVIPQGAGPFPAVVIMHNTGSNNREYYRIKAHHLAATGVASLIYDKPGTFDSSHESRPSFNHNTVQDLVDAALAGVEVLQGHPDVAADQIGLWGYSNSAWAVPLAASQSDEVAFMIDTAASGVPQRQADVFQEDLNNLSYYDYPGWAERTSLRYLRFTREFAIWAREWRLPLGAPPRDYYGQDFDPVPAWTTVDQPVLVINGQNDTLIDPVDGLARIGDALADGGNRDHTLVLLADADHSLYRSDTGLTPDVHGGRDLVYDPAFYPMVSDWIAARFHGTDTTPHTRSVLDSPVPIQRSRHFADGGRYAVLPWYGGPVLQVSLFLVFLVVFAGAAVVWPLGGTVRLVRRGLAANGEGGTPSIPTQLPTVDTLTRIVGWFGAVANLVVIFGLVITWVFVVHLRAEAFFGLPSWLQVMPTLGPVAALLAVIVIGLAVWTWRNGPQRGERGLAVFVVTQLAFVWYLGYWQLLG